MLLHNPYPSLIITFYPSKTKTSASNIFYQIENGQNQSKILNRVLNYSRDLKFEYIISISPSYCLLTFFLLRGKTESFYEFLFLQKKNHRQANLFNKKSMIAHNCSSWTPRQLPHPPLPLPHIEKNWMVADVNHIGGTPTEMRNSHTQKYLETLYKSLYRNITLLLHKIVVGN